MHLMTKLTDSIRKAFSDEEYDIIILLGVIFDRESFIDVKSEPIGEDEIIELKMKDATITFHGSAIERFVKAKEINRLMFHKLLSDVRVKCIMIDYKFDSNKAPLVLCRDDILLVEKNMENTMSVIVETKDSIYNIDFTQVSSIQATKKVED